MILSVMLVAQTLGGHAPPRASLELWYDRPASSWSEALPVGDGRLGPMVFGGVRKERLQLNDDTLWAGRPETRNSPRAADALPKTRKLLFEGEAVKGQELAQEALMSERWVRSYPSLGELSWTFDHPAGAELEAYRRWSNLETAIAGTRYRIGNVDSERRVLASPRDGPLVWEISSAPGALHGTVVLSRPDAKWSSKSMGDGQGPRTRRDGALQVSRRASAHPECRDRRSDRRANCAPRRIRKS